MSAVPAVVVTGARGALGRAMVSCAAASNFPVLAVTRQASAPADFPTAPTCHHRGEIDLSTANGARDLAMHVNQLFPQQRLFVLNCVGAFTRYESIVDSDCDAAAKMFASNFTAVFNCANALLPLMRKSQQGGHFVAFSTHSVYQAYPLIATLDTAKAAVAQLVRHIANEESQNHICANAFALATLLTDVEVALKPQGDHRAWLKPREVAETVLWFCQGPTRLVNGNVIHLFEYSDSYFHKSYFDRIAPQTRQERGAE